MLTKYGTDIILFVAGVDRWELPVIIAVFPFKVAELENLAPLNTT